MLNGVKLVCYCLGKSLLRVRYYNWLTFGHQSVTQFFSGAPTPRKNPGSAPEYCRNIPVVNRKLISNATRRFLVAYSWLELHCSPIRTLLTTTFVSLCFDIKIFNAILFDQAAFSYKNSASKVIYGTR